MATELPVGPNTLISVKVNYQGKNKTYHARFGDLSPDSIQNTLRVLLAIPQENYLVVERFSDSAGAFQIIHPANTQANRQLVRAAKAKRKIRLRVNYFADNRAAEASLFPVTHPSSPEPDSRIRSPQFTPNQENGLKAEHRDMFEDMFELAIKLYDENKYTEAEILLRQTISQREKVLGIEHVDTLNSKFWLARTFLKQRKHREAETLLREQVQQWERVLGASDSNALGAKTWLARSLHDQQKYDDAEKVWRQSAQEYEKALGADNDKSLLHKYGMAITLYEQQKYAEAEQILRSCVQYWEKVLGADHYTTIAGKERLQKVILAQAQSNATITLSDTVPQRLSDILTNTKDRQKPYTESEIQRISLLLKQFNQEWSKVPRTYIILRTIDCLDLLDSFIDLNFSDHWFPVTERSLPHCLHPMKRPQFVAMQHLVMTKSMDLEKGEKGQHCYFRPNETLPFEEKGILGAGGFGQVDRVLSLISFREYARKRVSRSTLFSGRKAEDVKRFIAEIEILKRLKHRHVVEFVGSYTDLKYLGLIVLPVADMDLSTYLSHAEISRHKELYTFFGCLVKALQFLHEENVRHKDIKPSNILVHGGNVLFTDFGLALDFAGAEGSTTVSMVNGMTPRYCAPEVANHEPRNTSSDIWSLGVVFLEMIAVLKGKGVGYVYKFLSEHGSRQAFVRTNPTGLYELIVEFKQVGDSNSNVPLEWVQDMLMTQQDLRPTAATLMGSIVGAAEYGSGGFCGICCVPLDNFLDDFEELRIGDVE